MDRFKIKTKAVNRCRETTRHRAAERRVQHKKSKAGKKAAQTIALSPLVFDARCRLLDFYFFYFSLSLTA